MRTDGKFDFRTVEIPVRYNETFSIIAHGDEHFNSPNFAEDRWMQDNEDMENLCKKQKTYFIKTGDVFEAMSTSERKAYIGAGLHDSNMSRWEAEYLAEIDDYLYHTKYMIGRTLAVFGGNHFFRFYDGTTSDQVLAKKLKAPYIGCSGYVVLTLNAGNKHTHVLKIFVHHGLGSGRGAGSTFNALDKAASYFPDADIIIMGHDHQAGAMHLPAINVEMGTGGIWKIKEHDRIIGRAGSYLKSYESGKVSYAVDAMYRPSTLGCLRIDVTVKRTEKKDEKGRRIDDRRICLQAVI